jgi:hypothetical protein
MRWQKYCWREKTISFTSSECVYTALVIQHAKRTRHIILSFMASLAPPYFSTLSHKRHDSRGKKQLFSKKYMFWFLLQFFSEIFLILRIRRDNINVNRSLIKYPLSFSDFNGTWIFSAGFRKICKYQMSWNPSSRSRVVPIGRTDMTKLEIIFRDFACAPKMKTNSGQHVKGFRIGTFE